MSPTFAAFAFCFLAGFVMTRLGRSKPLRRWERKLLRPLGWILMATSLSFAAALSAWGLMYHLAQ